MATPLRRRFSVNTSILDATAGIQSLSKLGIIVQTDTPIGDEISPGLIQPRFLNVTKIDYRDNPYVQPGDVQQLLYKGFMDTFFGQSQSPFNAVILYWHKEVLPGDEDGEAVAVALQDALDKGADPFFIAYEDNNTTTPTPEIVPDDIVAISAFCQSSDVRLMPVFCSMQARDETIATDDVISRLQGLAHETTQVYYYPEATAALNATIDTIEFNRIRPDAAILGYMSGGLNNEGVEQWDYKAMVGLPDPFMNQAAQDIIQGKGGNFVEQFERTSFTHVFKGRTVTGREARIQWGAMWHDVTFEQRLATRQFNSGLSAFDRETFDEVENICYSMKAEVLARRIIVDTVENPAVINFPDPDTFDAATRQAGVANLDNVYNYRLNSAIDEWHITGNWALGQ